MADPDCYKIKLDNSLRIRGDNMRKTLIAKEGFVYTNGNAYAKILDLAEGDKAENWYEITEMEYEEILRKQEEQE